VPTSTLTPATAPSQAPTVFTTFYRINCGGPTIVDALGNTWTSDTSLNPGGGTVTPKQYTDVNLANVAAAIDYGRLLDTERYSYLSLGPLRYRLAVPAAGAYAVTFVLCEVWHRNPGTRVYDVVVQGITVFERMDVVARFGFQNPVALTVLVNVTQAQVNGDGIVVELVPLQGSPEGPAVYGLLVTSPVDVVLPSTSVPTPAPTTAPTSPTPPPTLRPTRAPTTTPPPADAHWLAVTRINCGGAVGPALPVADDLGFEWVSDATFIQSSSTGVAITGVSTETYLVSAMSHLRPLFAKERAARMVEYVIPVSVEGFYQVRRAPLLSSLLHKSRQLA
jgi:hypothetical protein